MSRRKKIRLTVAGLLILGLGGAGLWMFNGILPVAPGDRGTVYIRYETPRRLGFVLADLEKKGIVRNGLAAHLLAYMERLGSNVPVGSYSVGPGMSAATLIRTLHHPVRQQIRLPETNWARRTANILHKHAVTSADDYMALVNDPQAFAGEVSFPLPKSSLEGYLYPDTYDLPPLYGAKRTIERQLETFQKRVWDKLNAPKDLDRTLIVASLVQLEAGTDADRPIIAGVIENRIAKKMPLQIDATIEYALQKWRRLTFRDYRQVKSPYNTYLVKGLPPGPICSPDAKDIEAALHPAKHNYLYYVALPNGTSIYAATYKDHLKNIERRKAALKAVRS